MLRVALLDLLADDYKDSVLDVGSRDVIYFRPTPADRSWTVDNALMSAARTKWSKLPASRRIAAAEAVAHLRDRVAADAVATPRPAPFAPSDPRIILREPDPGDRRGLESPRPLSAVPPGYSADGLTAVVCISFLWSMHSGDAVLLLRREGNGWKVVSKTINFYL